jgi:hypothetical protein
VRDCETRQRVTRNASSRRRKQIQLHPFDVHANGHRACLAFGCTRAFGFLKECDIHSRHANLARGVRRGRIPTVSLSNAETARSVAAARRSSASLGQSRPHPRGPCRLQQEYRRPARRNGCISSLDNMERRRARSKKFRSESFVSAPARDRSQRPAYPRPTFVVVATDQQEVSST